MGGFKWFKNKYLSSVNLPELVLLCIIFFLDFSSFAEVWMCLSQTCVLRKVFPAWVLCKALGAPRCPCPEDTCQLLHSREWSSPGVQFGSFHREETPGCVSSGRYVWQYHHGSDVTALPLASARGSEGSQRPVPQLLQLLPWQPQHKSHFNKLHINFSELKTCF